MSIGPWTALVSVEDLAAAMGDPALRVLDARATLADPAAGRAAHAASHLPGAVHADLDRDLSDQSVRGQGRHRGGLDRR